MPKPIDFEQSILGSYRLHSWENFFPDCFNPFDSMNKRRNSKQARSGSRGSSSKAVTKAKLDKQQIDSLRETFNLFDKNEDGQITANELKSIMKAFNRPCTTKFAMDILNDVDKNRNGAIDFSEFVELMAPMMQRSNEERMRDAFKFFDKDNDGCITTSELKEIINRLNVTLSTRDLNDMILEGDKDGDGKISYEEFRVLIGKRL